MNVPPDWIPEMELEEECTCGCEQYEPTDLEIVKGWKPMRIEVCVECKRARMNVSVWYKNKGELCTVN